MKHWKGCPERPQNQTPLHTARVLKCWECPAPHWTLGYRPQTSSFHHHYEPSLSPFPQSWGILRGIEIAGAAPGRAMSLPLGTLPWFSSWSSCRMMGLRQPCTWRSWQDTSAFQGGCRWAKKNWYSLSDRGLPGTGRTGGATQDISEASRPGGKAGCA